MASPTSSWYSDERFSSFWQHYNTMMSAAHRDAVVRAGYVANQTKAALSNLNGMYGHHREQSYRSSPESRNQHKAKSRKTRYKRQKKNSRRKQNQNIQKNVPESQSDTESLYSQMKQGMQIQDAKEDMEVTEDFLMFLEQSKKHREEWKVMKFQKSDSVEKTSLNTDKVAQDTEIKEHPDVIRSREMKQLYGQASPKLLAMETALQLSFDRNATLHQPQNWPNTPLNVMFN